MRPKRDEQNPQNIVTKIKLHYLYSAHKKLHSCSKWVTGCSQTPKDLKFKYIDLKIMKRKRK